ncbi:hypothetical protein EXN67_01415 [Rhizobium rhizogenes]|nr:hypothetical protein [Rhizobium rhizogenes]TRB14799.1 hypothetical protein EXN67_01415 [Rhizobium rhizogenes]TRB47591.1 hypothetical protein EXN73_01415 [Rhizobium rhizogenes]TRB65359.1 hypothetical protein EXN71_01415 [Rhizobium rhizogenes]
MIAKLLGGSELAAWAVISLLMVAAFGGTYALADHRGYGRAETHYTAQIAQMKADAATARADEIDRQSAVNDAAKAAEARRIAEIQAANQSLQIQIEELQREADQDPDANRSALGADSVRRINQIR